MKFCHINRVLQRLVLVSCLLALGMGFLPQAALAQNFPGIAAGPATEETWVPPDITALSASWWTNLIAGPEESFNERTRLLVQSLEERSKSLGPEDQATR